MKCHTAAYIPDPEAFVQDFIQLFDIISYIGQNKNTLGAFDPQGILNPGKIFN